MVKVLRKVLLLTALFLVLMITAAFAVDYGMVTTDVLNFRAGPGTNYEVIGQLTRGEVVRIIGNGGNNWVQIVYNGREGYVSLAYLNVRSVEETDRGSVDRTAQSGYVTASALNMRNGPSTSSGIIRVLGNGQAVTITEDVGNGWYRISVDGQNGYVSNSYIAVGQVSASGSSKGEQVIAFAKRFLGTPYRYGGMSPGGFDCSGFTKYVFSNFGINLGRTTYDQVNNGSYVDKWNLQPGDLVLFQQGSGVDHVGIFCGGGTFIHATKPGDVVKVDSLNSGYYSRYYHSGRRVIY